MNAELFVGYHGLVVVHPDFSHRPKHPEYVDNLSSAVDLFHSSGRPIFVARNKVNNPSANIWGTLNLVGAHTLPISDPSDGIFVSLEEYLRQNQQEVDFIVRRIGMEHQNIRLAFGGLYAEHCVYAFATAYCERVETEYPNEEREPVALHPIGFGKVFREIV
ncbi:hypothetical protein HZB02_07340 [Candidatus Woesearchaeota archaeon]|nr:hypothetical protein [Candidatus Woesearchaeota archaeon]